MIPHTCTRMAVVAGHRRCPPSGPWFPRATCGSPVSFP